MIMTETRSLADLTPRSAGAAGERCRNSLHAHGIMPGTSGGLLDWEAERFQQAVERLGLDSALNCALHCAVRSVEVELPAGFNQPPVDRRDERGGLA